MNSVFAPGLFRQKICLVTGGGSGIGKAIAKELFSLGGTVVIASRNETKLKSAVAEIESTSSSSSSPLCGAISMICGMNIRDELSVADAVRHTLDAHGRIDCLVNNAGGQFMSSAKDIRPKGWRAVVETNLNGTWIVTHAVYSALPGPAQRFVHCQYYR